MLLGKIRMSDFTGIYAPQKFHITNQITSTQELTVQLKNSRTPHSKNDIVVVSKKWEYKSILVIETSCLSSEILQ